MDRSMIRQTILDGRAVLGIEIDRSYIKTILIDDVENAPIAMGAFDFNRNSEHESEALYPVTVLFGMREAFASLMRDVQDKYAVRIRKIAAIGLCASTSEYYPLDESHRLIIAPIVPSTSVINRKHNRSSVDEMICDPEVATLYNALLDDEQCLCSLSYLTTIAGYIYLQLTGQHCLGAGEASRMCKLDGSPVGYDPKALDWIDSLARSKGADWKIDEVLPRILYAGDDSGRLTPSGALLLDPSGELEPGSVIAPPESGIAAEMVAAGSVAQRSGCLIVDTSMRAMIVPEYPLCGVYPDITLSATPDGKQVALIQHDAFDRDINVWIGILSGFAEEIGGARSNKAIYSAMLNAAVNAEPNCGGMVSILRSRDASSDENGFASRSVMACDADAHMTFGNLTRSILFGTIASISCAINVLRVKENCRIDRIVGMGGFFKARNVGQRLAAAALNIPIAVMKPDQGGRAWASCVLAAFCLWNKQDRTLEEFLETRVFCSCDLIVEQPRTEDVEGFAQYLNRLIRATETHVNS